MRRALHLTAAGLLAVSSAACGNPLKQLINSPTGAALQEAVQTPAGQSMASGSWRLVTLNGTPALPGVKVTVEFFDPKRVAGSSGCNRYMGGAAVNGEEIKVSLLASTMMYCGEPGVMDQEFAYIGALQKATVYRTAGSELQLGPAAGSVSLVFARE